MTAAIANPSQRIAALSKQADQLADVPDHRGQPRSLEIDLFVYPPQEIGPVISAESTLFTGKREISLPMRIAIVALPAWLLVCFTLWFAQQQPIHVRHALVSFGYIFGILLAVISWRLTRFSHRCTYVGQDGAAIFKLRGRRDAQCASQILVFAQADELRARQTRHFVNGVYTRTSYNYTWSDASGTRLLRMIGTYVGKSTPPKPKDIFHFIAAAELAWSNFYLARAQAQLEKEGSIAFAVDSKRMVRVGPGFMEFHFGGEPARITRQEIGGVSLAGGHFSFKHKDAKWYNLEGKYRFSYGNMANGKVFLLALQKLMGYAWK